MPTHEIEILEMILKGGSTPAMIVFALGYLGKRWYDGIMKRFDDMQTKFADHRINCEQRICKIEQTLSSDSIKTLSGTISQMKIDMAAIKGTQDYIATETARLRRRDAYNETPTTKNRRTNV
jgi:hypothetical protein